MSATSDEPGRARRAYEIFAAALELKPAERGAFVDGACGGDPALRGEVDRLLAAAEDPPPDGAGALGDRAPHLLAALEEELSAAPPAGAGQRIGPYRLVEVLGRGGMGVVWLAERDDGAFSKRVALKIVPDWEASDDLPRRLRAERQILAGLEHPNIARLLDGGVTAEGVPYLVMEHVEGEPIDAYCEGRDLGVRDRLALVLAVCDAVAAAHRRLVVHRDLKPGNILVTAEGGVKLLDFGIAKLLDEGGDGGPTRTGLHPLTPQFAAPEQLTGGPITTATDVWGLGALLYRLLAGRSPHAAQGTTTQAVMRAICEEDPRPPSRAARQPQLARHLAGDLDAIALRALRREPAERYASVEALADDLRRHLRGLPVAARPPSLAYRARKLARRRPGAVAAAALALGAIVVVVLGLLQQARLAERERLRAEAVTAFFTGVLRQADPDEARGGEITLRQLLDHSVAQLEGTLAEQAQLRAEVLAVIGEAYLNLSLVDSAVVALAEVLDLRRGLHGPRHPATLEALAQLAVARTFACREADLPSLHGQFEQARTLTASLHGARSVEAARVAHQYGLMHRRCYGASQPEHGRSEHWLRQAVDILREQGGDSAELAAALHDLRGFVPEHQTESLLREALAMRRRLFGERDVRVAGSLNDLGLYLEGRGRAAEAEELVRQALGLYRELLGPRHPTTVTISNNLAGILRDQERFVEAEPLYREVLEVMASRLPADHNRLSFPHYGLGRVLMGQGKLAAAEAHLRRAYEILTADDRKLAGVAASVLGECLAMQGRFDEALPLLESGYRQVADLLGPESREGRLSAARLERYGRALAAP